jgi:hypothetical protein
VLVLEELELGAGIQLVGALGHQGTGAGLALLSIVQKGKGEPSCGT